MIKSRVIKLGYFVSLLGFWGGIGAFVFVTKAAFSNTIVGKSQMPAVIFSYTVITLLIAIYGKLLWDSKIISIDIELRQIKMTNRFTRISKVYDFSYFDGSIIIQEPIKGGWARNCYLIKERKAIKRISNFIYSNQKEIEAGIKDIKDLGEIQYNYLNSAKIFFGYPIISIDTK